MTIEKIPVYVVNMSATGAISSTSLRLAFQAFTNLETYYQARDWNQYLCRTDSTNVAYYSSYLFLPTTYPAVAWRYYKEQSLQDLITHYKLGHIDNDDFFNGLLEFFPVLKTADFKESDYCIIDMMRQKEQLPMLQKYGGEIDFKNPDHKKDIAKALLQIAWNEYLQFSPAGDERFNSLIAFANQDSEGGEDFANKIVHCVSFTNFANFQKILLHHKENLLITAGEKETLEDSINGRYTKEKPYSQLGNIRFSTSHQAQAFKIEGVQGISSEITSAVTTSCLIEQLRSLYPSDKYDVTVVSQYPDDIQQARECRFNTLDVKSFFDLVERELAESRAQLKMR